MEDPECVLKPGQNLSTPIVSQPRVYVHTCSTECSAHVSSALFLRIQLLLSPVLGREGGIAGQAKHPRSLRRRRPPRWVGSYPCHHGEKNAKVLCRDFQRVSLKWGTLQYVGMWTSYNVSWFIPRRPELSRGSTATDSGGQGQARADALHRVRILLLGQGEAFTSEVKVQRGLGDGIGEYILWCTLRLYVQTHRWNIYRWLIYYIENWAPSIWSDLWRRVCTPIQPA